MPPKKAAGKKNKNDDDWDDDAAEKKLAALKLKEEKEKEDAEWDAESEDEKPQPKASKAGKKAAFSMLMDDDDDGSGGDDSDKDTSHHEVEDATPTVTATASSRAAGGAQQTKKNEKKKGKKGKKGKQEDDDDEDLDAILANLEKEDRAKGKIVEAVEPKEDSPVQVVAEATPTDPAAEDKKKKKKKKDKKKGEGKEEDGAEKEDVTEKPEGEDEEGEGDKKEDGDDEDDAAKKKNKKKKDKKKEKKEDKEGGKKDKKKKNINFIKEVLEAQQRAKEAELKKIEEEEARLERIRKEKEEEEARIRAKKEAEKEKKRIQIEQQKASGTYMTAAQKKKQQMAAEKLAAAGIVIPQPGEEGEKKKVVYQDKRDIKRQKERELKKQQELAAAAAAAAGTATGAKSTGGEVSSASPSIPATPAPTPNESKAPSPEPKEATPEDKDEEPLEDWELADIDTPKTPIAKEAKTTQLATSKVKEEQEEDEEEDEDEESSSEEESSSSDDDEEEESSEEEEANKKGKETQEEMLERVGNKIKKRREEAEAARTTDKLRAPVICVLGHVDTGKTKLLDTIRRTNVQDGEAGGITQQIGATEVPAAAIKERCKQVQDFNPEDFHLPGYLIIDTPGHESFANLRYRGSSLCDFAILVVDIMHGLEQQTIESLKLLLKRKTPFVIALNKIDRLYSYEPNPRKDVYQHLKSQPQNTQNEFKERYDKIVGEFSEQGINVILSKLNKNTEEYFSMVPTSAIQGDGIGNLLAHIGKVSQNEYAKRLAYCKELDASVMEVKVIPGLGTTIDVILVNGVLHQQDVIVLTGSDGAILTQVREILTPPPLKEMRVKNEYKKNPSIEAAQGIKVLAKGLEKALAGLPLYVATTPDEADYYKVLAEKNLDNALTSIKKKPEGVYVQASTLGSLEALLEFLKTQKIPFSNVNIGPVHKKDVQKAAAMLSHNKAEYACILAFDVKIEKEAQQYADHEGVKIFAADIIYHLQDNFLKHREDLRQKARKENEHLAIFPCKLRVLPQHVFASRSPIICGVVVEQGQLKRGTPICVPTKECLFLGTVSSLQRNNDEVPIAKAGDEVCIKIENTTGEAAKMYGRHFDHTDPLVSRISRESIDVCKAYFKNDLTQADWQLIVALKRQLDIM